MANHPSSVGQGQKASGVSRPSWVYIVLMLGAACSYGVVSTVLKLAYRHGFASSQMTAAQYDTALVVSWLIALVWPSRRGIRRAQWPLLIVISLAGTATSFTYYYALTELPASVAIVLLFQFTWMVPVMEMVVKRRWLRGPQWLGLLGIVIGTFLAVGIGRHQMAHMRTLGILCGLIAAFCYALQLYVNEFLDESSSPAFRSAILISMSAAATGFVASPGWLFQTAAWLQLLFWGLLAGVFSQVLPMLLMSASIPRIGGRMAGILGAAELPTVVLMAWIVLREAVTLEQWAGVVLILLGMVVSEWLGRKASAESP